MFPNIKKMEDSLLEIETSICDLQRVLEEQKKTNAMLEIIASHFNEKAVKEWKERNEHRK